jgi:hypothetical protein
MALPVPALMRRNTTANIARSFGARPMTSMPPPAEHTTPIQGNWAQGAVNPANPTNMAAWNYLDLMRSAGRPIEHIDPIWGDPGSRELGGGNTAPPPDPELPGGSSLPDPNIDPAGTVVGNYDSSIYHDFFQGDPRYPGGHSPVGGPHVSVMPPDTGMTHGVDIDGNPVEPVNPLQYTTSPGNRRFLPGSGPETGGDRGPSFVGATGGPTFGGGPHIPSTGGQVGVGHDTTPKEPWYGKLLRFAPYVGPIASIAHPILAYARRHGPGTIGGPARIAGSPRTSTGPVQPRPVAATSPALPTGGLLSPKAYGQQTFGGVTPTGYRDPTGSSVHDSHANLMQLLASTANAGQANRNLVSDNLNEARSEHPYAAHGTLSPAAQAAFAQMYGRTGVRTNAAMMGGG